MEEFVQVGFTALRGPKGEYLPAVPLYVKKEAGAENAEQELVRDIGHLLALRMKAYVDGCREAGAEV
jgi:hypothetical protein